MDPITATPTQLQELMTRLSPRQMEIAAMLVEGRTGAEIASILSISRGAVKQHIRKMCWKSGLENRTQLIVLIVCWKIYSLPAVSG